MPRNAVLRGRGKLPLRRKRRPLCAGRSEALAQGHQAASMRASDPWTVRIFDEEIVKAPVAVIENIDFDAGFNTSDG